MSPETVHRDFKMHENWRLSLQADGFNILNSVYFGAPGANIDAASSGTGDESGESAEETAIDRPDHVLKLRHRPKARRAPAPGVVAV